MVCVDNQIFQTFFTMENKDEGQERGPLAAACGRNASLQTGSNVPFLS